jgi:hypothetical protein
MIYVLGRKAKRKATLKDRPAGQIIEVRRSLSILYKLATIDGYYPRGPSQKGRPATRPISDIMGY